MKTRIGETPRIRSILPTGRFVPVNFREMMRILGKSRDQVGPFQKESWPGKQSECWQGARMHHKLDATHEVIRVAVADSTYIHTQLLAEALERDPELKIVAAHSVELIETANPNWDDLYPSITAR